MFLISTNMAIHKFLVPMSTHFVRLSISVHGDCVWEIFFFLFLSRNNIAMIVMIAVFVCYVLHPLWATYYSCLMWPKISLSCLRKKIMCHLLVNKKKSLQHRGSFFEILGVFQDQRAFMSGGISVDERLKNKHLQTVQRHGHRLFCALGMWIRVKLWLDSNLFCSHRCFEVDTRTDLFDVGTFFRHNPRHKGPREGGNPGGVECDLWGGGHSEKAGHRSDAHQHWIHSHCPPLLPGLSHWWV